MADYLEHQEHLEFDRIHATVARRLNPEGGETFMLSLFTNFYLKDLNTFSSETIKRFGKVLGTTGTPKWYLDQKRYLWFRGVHKQ